MTPPKGDGVTGQARIAKYNLDPTGYLICNTGKQDRIDNAFKLLDWMYSDEGSELLSWGKEGETYKVVDGKKKFIVGENETPQEKYGAATYGPVSYTHLLCERRSANAHRFRHYRGSGRQD